MRSLMRLRRRINKIAQGLKEGGRGGYLAAQERGQEKGHPVFPPTA